MMPCNWPSWALEWIISYKLNPLTQGLHHLSCLASRYSCALPSAAKYLILFVLRFSRSLSCLEVSIYRPLCLHCLMAATPQGSECLLSSSEVAGEGLRKLEMLLRAARRLLAAYAGEEGVSEAPASASADTLHPAALVDARQGYLAARSELRATLQQLTARQQQERRQPRASDQPGAFV